MPFQLLSVSIQDNLYIILSFYCFFSFNWFFHLIFHHQTTLNFGFWHDWFLTLFADLKMLFKTVSQLIIFKASLKLNFKMALKCIILLVFKWFIFPKKLYLFIVEYNTVVQRNDHLYATEQKKCTKFSDMS